jgi:hypothetical protein
MMGGRACLEGEVLNIGYNNTELTAVVFGRPLILPIAGVFDARIGLVRREPLLPASPMAVTTPLNSCT